MYLLEQITWFNNLPAGVQDAIIRILVLIFALVLLLALRGILRWLILVPLRKLTERTSIKTDETLIDAAAPAVRLLLIALALFISAQILQMDSVFLERVIRSLVIVAVLVLLNQLIGVLLPSSKRVFALTGITIEERLLPFVRVTVRLLIVCAGVVIVLQEWGYDVSGLVAGIGLGGLAFSLAAQDTVANLFGFIAIVGDRPFNVGDYIKTPDVEGNVEYVGLRSTRVRQLDQALVMVPNNKLANSAILNWSRLVKRRIDYVLSIRYGTTSQEMSALLNQLRDYLKSQETVEADSVIVNFINFGDSALEVLIRAYVKKADWGEFTLEKERIHLDVMDMVKRAGLNIAFPSRSLYIENLPSIAVESELLERDQDGREALPKMGRMMIETRMPHGDEADEGEDGVGGPGTPK
jgi:MscS family membrane protein